MTWLNNDRGVSLIAAIFIIIVLGFMGVMFLTMINTSSLTTVNDLQSTQALSIAEGGMEYILENRAFPNYSMGGATMNLGTGNFTVSTPTYLTADPGAAGTTITVQSTATFPNAGRIIIDSELITYTGKNATQFNAGVVRGAGGTTAVSHPTANSAVYPVTTVTDNPLAAASVSINVGSTVGFLLPGIIKIDEEYIYCTGTNVGNNQFTGCTRGNKGTTADSHPQNRNVFQYIVSSTGMVANAKRQVGRAEVGTGMSTHQGSFTKDNTGVANAQQAITGVGFTPRALIFFWTRQTAAGFSANVNGGIGFTSGSANEFGVSVCGVDNSATSDDGRRRSNTHMIIFLSGGGGAGLPTVLAEADLTSFDADGFTIRWTTNDVNAYRIHYIALGGDISNAQAGTFTFTTGGVGGNLPVAGVGFQPDFVMFLSSFTEAVDTAGIASAAIGIGLAQNNLAQGAVAYAARDNTANNRPKRWYQRTDSCILILNPTGNPPTEDARASFVSMDANGFTINKINPPAANTGIFYLALKGGRHDVGSFLQPLANVGAVGFQPEQVLLISRGLIASNTIDFLGGVTIGAAQRLGTQGSVWFQNIGGTAANPPPDPSEANMYTQTTDIMTFATGPATVNARATFGLFNSDGFTLNWPTNDGTARQIIYWAVGPNVARSGPQPQIKPVNLDWREVYP